MKVIEIELARKIIQKGDFVVSIPSPLSAPDGRQCESHLMVYDFKFFVLTVVDMPEKESIALMKGGHIELTADEAKETFNGIVDFYEIDATKLPKDFNHNIISLN